MANRFYTILIVPEKTDKITKLRIPSWIVQGFVATVIGTGLLSSVMFFDYWYAVGQIAENQELKKENRSLKHRVQMIENKIFIIENVMDRLKNFSARLRLIMQLDTDNPNNPTKTDNLRGDFSPGSSSPLAPSAETSLLPSFFSPSTSRLNPDAESADLRGRILSLADQSEPDIEMSMRELLEKSLQTESFLQQAYEALADKKSFLAALPTMQPAEGYFSSGFGFRISPFGNRIKMHEGIDIANHPGTPVRAPADGEITFAGSKTGYGLTLIINHGYGIETWYAHLRNFTRARGEKVKRGMQIAAIGTSGRATGPHVHYEVHVHGYPVDPRSYIFEEARPYTEL
jgi:murein DD-endopeptidase MepM/ murein hydrolase activator NlpD